jgi:phosphoglycerate dehydrogenase-like enzyme
MKFMAYRRKARGDEGVPVITGDQLAGAMAQADHIVNILPDNPESRHFFNAQRFADFKPGAVFYNIGRGSTVDQDALLAALRTGRVGAAWLDVTDPEPLPDDHPLWAEPNCFITPHVAGGHFEEARTLVRHFLQNFERFVRGELLLDRVM